RAAGAQVFEIAKAGQVQVAAASVTGHRVFAAVEAEVFQLRSQLAQRRAPGALAAANVQHAAQRALQVVFGGRDRQRDLAGQAGGMAHSAAAVPAVKVLTVIGLGHRVILMAPIGGCASMAYMLTKTTHLVFVIAWMATVFYLPRILVNIAEAGNEPAVRTRLV